MKSPDKTSNAPVGVPTANSYTSHIYRDCGFPPPARSAPMQHDPGFSEMLATLHPSLGEDAKSARVVAQLCRLTSLSTAFLISFNPKPRRQELTVRGGAAFMKEGQALYNDSLRDSTTRTSQVASTPGTEFAFQEQSYTQLHSDVSTRHELHHLAILPLVSTPPHSDALRTWRGGDAREFDAEILHLFQCAVPHLRAAQVLGRELAAASLRAARAEAALEHTSAAAFLLDSVGRVVHMNSSAEEIVSSADGLILRRNKIIATNSAQQSKLRLLIGAAIDTAQTSPPSPAGAIALERTSGRRPLFVRVLPLHVHLESGQTSPGHALLLITDPDGPVHDATSLLKDLFSLTAAEIAVAVNLRVGLTLADIAAARGVGLETVRSQVKSVLQKTNTRRQSDLMLLLTTLIT
jgi:DNA-binding CsgD family transcriptional regulator